MWRSSYVWHDLRYAMRILGHNPRFAAAAILTLAMGIGATTAMFRVIDAVMLRPLAYRDPDRLYVVHEVLPQLKAPVVAVNATHFREWRSATRSFEDMALLHGFDLNVTGPGEPERISAARVSPSLFPMLGIRAEFGRTFLEEEDQPGRDRRGGHGAGHRLRERRAPVVRARERTAPRNGHSVGDRGHSRPPDLAADR
jgi:putative ABC transport system permease protein